MNNKIELGDFYKTLQNIRPDKEVYLKKEYIVYPEEVRLRAIDTLTKIGFIMIKIHPKFAKQMCVEDGYTWTTLFIDIATEKESDFFRVVMFSESSKKRDFDKNKKGFINKADIFLFIAHSSSLGVGDSFPENPDMLVKIGKNNDILVKKKQDPKFNKATGKELTDFYLLLQDLQEVGA